MYRSIKKSLNQENPMK